VPNPQTQTAKLTASDGAASDSFGIAVAISGDTVVVGAYLAKVGTHNFQGAAYLFGKPVGGWGSVPNPQTETGKLTALDGAAGDFFGAAVAISGPTVVVGAYNATVSGNLNQGAAYVFGFLAAQAAKQKVLDDLKAVLPTANTVTKTLLKAAITPLTTSLNPIYYVDATRLKSTTGTNVFAFEMVAIRQLLTIPNPPAPVRAALAALPMADEGFAQVAIADAIARGGKASKIAAAQTLLTQGIAAASKGDHYGAIHLFLQAWLAAQGA
jgi:hypothetical protein